MNAVSPKASLVKLGLYPRPKALKVMVLGQSGVGKSAMVVRFITRRYIGDYDPTLEKIYTFHTVIDNEMVCFDILDTAGQPDKLKGTTQALQMLTTSEGTRYEFLFTNLVPGNMRHFTSVMGVHKAYNSSKLYRELRLRGAVVHNKQLKMLSLEQVFSTIHGVWNLSSDQGSLGTFIITNVRLVWFADVNEAFNVSLPYLHIDGISIRDSKFGTALVIVSGEMSGGYVLGFKVDPEEKLRQLYKELSSLHTVYSTKPIFGVEYNWSSNKSELEQNNNLVEDYDGIEEPQGEMSNTIAAYLAEEGHKSRLPVYSPELGLAVESIKEGYTLQKLWEVIPS